MSPLLFFAKYLATAQNANSHVEFRPHLNPRSLWDDAPCPESDLDVRTPGRLASMSNLVSPHGGWRQLSWRLATAFPAHAHVVRLHGVSRRGITHALSRSWPMRR
jgi:hypothetical protein